MVEEKISLPAAFIIQSMLKASKFISPAFEVKNTGFIFILLKFFLYLILSRKLKC